MRIERIILISLSSLGLGISFIGCGRKGQESASVVITLPAASSKMSTADYSILSDSNPTDDDLPWTSVIPDGLSGQAGVKYPINCYALMVEGAEQSMRMNMCGRRNSGTGKLDPAQFNFNVGMWRGAIPGDTSGAANTITMDVPVGLARIFRLIGFYVSDPVHCVLFSGKIPEGKFSHPYVIAQSAPIDLTPGEKEVPLVMSFDAQKWFDECDFGDGSGNSSPVYATQVQIRKETFPMYKLLQVLTPSTLTLCQPIEAQLTDDQGRPAQLPSGFNKVSYSLENSGTPLTTYATKIGCKNNLSGASSFDILSGSSQPVRRWIAIPPGSATGSYQLALTESGRDPSTKVEVIQPQAVMTIPLVAPTESFYDIIGPRIGYKGETYKVDVIHRLFNGYHFSPGADGLTLTHSSTETDYFFYEYTAGSCGTTDLSGFDMGSVFKRTFCLKHTATENASINFTEPFFSHFETRGGSPQPHHLQIIGRHQLAAPTTGSRCFGPFAVTLENEYGVTVNNKAASALNVAFNYRLDSPVSGANITIHNDANYSTALSCINPWVSASPAVIPVNDYKTYFYVEVQQGAVSGVRKVDMSVLLSDNSTIKGTFQFSIDVDD